MYYKAQYESSVGMITLVSDEEKLVGAWVEGQKYFMGRLSELVTKKEEYVGTGYWRCSGT